MPIQVDSNNECICEDNPSHTWLYAATVVVMIPTDPKGTLIIFRLVSDASFHQTTIDFKNSGFYDRIRLLVTSSFHPLTPLGAHCFIRPST